MDNEFSRNKSELMNELNKQHKQISSVSQKLNLDCSDLLDKIEEVITNLKKEKFIIVFFGAFSDGKSTVLSSMIKNLDIKIDPAPTTNKISTYTYEDFLIVDTPGLYSDQIEHDKESLSYISNSNLVLYTVDSVNPLKETHHKTIKWLLSDINKIDSTIFIINKMDLVADLENNEDFQENSNIKKEVVEETLNSIITIKMKPIIVCISADPFDRGLEEWMKEDNKIKYEQISRIRDLDLIVKKFISDGKEKLFINTGYSVLSDVKNKFKDNLVFLKNEINKGLPVLKNQVSEMTNRLNSFSKEVSRKYISIKEELLAYREDIMMLISNASDLSDLRVKIGAQLGDDAWIVHEQIDLIFKKNTEVLLDSQDKVLKQIEESLEYHGKLQDEIVDQAVKVGGNIGKQIAEKSPRIIADTVIKTRDFLKLPIKFKPWGALKFAHGLQAFAKALPVIIDAILIYKHFKDMQKLEEDKSKILKYIDDLFKALFEDFTIEEYTNQYFPFISKLQVNFEEINVLHNRYEKSIIDIEKFLIETTELG